MGEKQILFACAEVDKEVDRAIVCLKGSGTVAIDLVDANDRLELVLESLSEHKSGLRHRAFTSVDNQKNAIDHAEHALDFSAEVCVAGGIDNVDLVVAVVNASDLGEDGDALLSLKVIGVHDPVLHVLIFSK